MELGADAGLLLPLSTDPSTSSYKAPLGFLSERFYLGGMPSLRGFKQGGAGPAALRRPMGGVSDSAASDAPGSDTPRKIAIGSSHDALGCDAYATVQVTIYMYHI